MYLVYVVPYAVTYILHSISVSFHTVWPNLLPTVGVFVRMNTSLTLTVLYKLFIRQSKILPFPQSLILMGSEKQDLLFRIIHAS